MHSANIPQSLRRSSRVPTAVPILVTSLDGPQFSEVCQTLVVNAHGCLMLSPVKLDSGAPLRFHTKEGREATAHVVSCQPVGSDTHNWRLSARLDRPENFWGVKNCPKDWALPSVLVQTRPPQSVSPNTLPAHHLPAQHLPAHQMTLPARQTSEAPTEAMIDRAARQMEAHVRQLIEEKVAEKIQEKIKEEIEGKIEEKIAESVSPLQAEIASLREQLAERKAKPPRFEVSLSSIPPELERQLETRLKDNLAPRALEEARQQYTNLLAAAKAAIDQKTREGHEDFLRKVAEELKGVEKRAQDISMHISGSAREHLHRGLDGFHEQLVEGGNSLKRLSEELLQFVHDSLHTEHGARLAELEQLRATVAAESSRLHEHIEYLDVRIRNLDESVRTMESGLDKRLSQMSSNTVKESRRQLESVGNDILEEWTARGAAAAANQVEEATAKMKTVQEEIVATEHESLKNQAANALQDFENSMEEAARGTVERWRLKLAGGLQVLAKSVGEQFQLGSGSDKEREH